MLATVIICTHNPRREYLSRVLAALQAQTLPRTQWELLLIDNGSKSRLSTQFDLSWHPHSRHIREEELGLTPARLRGIKESRADTLVFVDDDNVLNANYLEQALAISKEWPFIGVWGGSLVPEFAVKPPDWCWDQSWRLAILDVKEDIWSNLKNDFRTIPAGAGMCVRRVVADCYLKYCAANPWRTSLDRTGTGLGGYGDIDLAHCALDIGLGAGRSTRLSLTHLIPASRLTLDYFVRHAEGDAISLAMFRVGRGLPVEKPGKLTFIGELRWYIHRVKTRMPEEVFEIQKAYRRGAENGYKMAMEFLDLNKKQNQ